MRDYASGRRGLLHSLSGGSIPSSRTNLSDNEINHYLNEREYSMLVPMFGSAIFIGGGFGLLLVIVVVVLLLRR